MLQNNLSKQDLSLHRSHINIYGFSADILYGISA